MSVHKFIGSLNRRLLFAAVLASCSMSALGQQAPAEPKEKEQLQEIVVTGSRIASPNAVSTSPIVALSSTYIEDSGKTDIGDIITRLPQNFNNSLGQDLGNGTSGLTTAGGVSTADLRGLGPNRTLVLVDGRRLGQGSPYTFIQSPAPDLDQIPSGLVERIEVVTGGASAVYGADAIAGVVNFIMKKNFQGFQVEGQLDENYHDNDSWVAPLVKQFGYNPPSGTIQDGHTQNWDMLMGTNFADGKGNITTFLSYRHQQAVPSANRDFGSCQLGPTFGANGLVNGTTCGGSSNSNYFEPETGPNAHTAYSVFGTGFVPNGTPGTTPPAIFNSQPYIYMTREDDRYNGAFLAHDTITDYFQPYAELYFMDDRTHQQIAPSALFKDSNPLDPLTGNYWVNCDNPLLSASQRSTLCSPAQITAATSAPGTPCTLTAGALSPNCVDVRIGRRNVEGGGRYSDYEHENYRAVFGSKGDFANDVWSYDLYGQYYYTTFFNNNGRYENFQSITNALQVTGTRANPVCISGPPCVPYNIWSDGGVTQQQLAYLYTAGTGQGTSTLRTLHADFTGQLGKYGITSPWAQEGTAVNVGYEHRNDNEYFQPDAAEQSGLLSGFGSAAVPINSSVAVSEGFIELRAPLMQDKPGVKDLLFDSGYRISHYTTSGTTNTYKFEVQYSPISDYRFRGSYNKAIRAPTVVELFNPQLVGLIQFGNDPCAPTLSSTGVLIPAIYSFAQCANQKVTQAQYGNGSTTNIIPQGTAGQLSQATGGNPNLQPEEAETYTIGLNFAPSQVPNLTGSIDYYHIAITGEVGVIPASVIMTNCANTGNPAYCSQIVRSPTTGGLVGNNLAAGGYIVQTNQNVGAALVSGIDVQLRYKFDLPRNLGHMVFDMNGAYLQHWDSTPIPGAHTYDCAGLFGFTCQTIDPRWQHQLRSSWVTPWNVTAAMTWRYIGKVAQDNNDGDPTLHYATYATYDLFNSHIAAYNYFDLATTWDVNKVLQLRAGVNNIADKLPPTINYPIAAGGAANTYDIYDQFGRQLFVAFTAKF